MASNSMQQLSEKLTERQEQDRERFQAQTQKRLTEHDESLRKLATDSLSGAKAATQYETKRLRQSLDKHRTEIEGLTEVFTEVHKREARRLRWVMRLPLVVILVAVLALSVLTSAWWTWNQPWELRLMSDGRKYQVIKGEWMTCRIDGERRPCRPAPDGWIDSTNR